MRANQGLREIDLLPVLHVDLENAINIQAADSGYFKYIHNVKDKKLPFEVRENLKKALKDIGLTEYWANFVIHKAAENSGAPNLGAYIANMLPYSNILYGNRVADAINKELGDIVLVDIDPYIDGIIPGYNLEGMEFVYVVDSNKINFNGNYLVIVTGAEYGLRDDFTVTVKSGGLEFIAEKRALNGEEVAFVAAVPNMRDLQITYNSSFEKPVDIAFEVARGIQKGINDLSPLGSPISNDFRDTIARSINNLAYYVEKTTVDEDGNEKTEAKEVSLNDILGDGDVGVIVTDLIKNIPVIGQVIEPVLMVFGGDDKLAEIVRTAVGQAEVKSFASLNNGKIYLKQFNSVEEMKREIDNLTTEAEVNLFDYVDIPK